MNKDEIIATLCLKCGLCCNGALFGDVELQRSDAAAPLKEAGLNPRRKRGGAQAIPQPCRALGGDCRCSIYENRPRHCRDFECLLLGEVLDGTIKTATAQRVIRRAKKLYAEAEELIATLSDVAKGKPLRERFRRISGILETYDADDETLAVYGELTHVWLELNHLLGTRFYRED